MSNGTSTNISRNEPESRCEWCRNVNTAYTWYGMENCKGCWCATSPPASAESVAVDVTAAVALYRFAAQLPPHAHSPAPAPAHAELHA